MIAVGEGADLGELIGGLIGVGIFAFIFYMICEFIDWLRK